MKRTKIKYNNQYYDCVVYLLYPGIEQFKELGAVLKHDYLRKHKQSESNITAQAYRLNDTHAVILIKINGKTVRKSLVFATNRAQYPTVDYVAEINEQAQCLFEEEGIYGYLGIRDTSLLENIVAEVQNSIFFGEDQIPTIIQKAATYWWKFAHYQVFNNGNKRTGLLTASLFLNINFIKIDFDMEKLYNVSKGISSNNMTVEDVYHFLLEMTSFDYKKLTKDYLKNN